MASNNYRKLTPNLDKIKNKMINLIWPNMNISDFNYNFKSIFTSMIDTTEYDHISTYISNNIITHNITTPQHTRRRIQSNDTNNVIRDINFIIEFTKSYRIKIKYKLFKELSNSKILRILSYYDTKYYAIYNNGFIIIVNELSLLIGDISLDSQILFNNKIIGDVLSNYYTLGENNDIYVRYNEKVQYYGFINWELEYTSMQQFVNQLLTVYKFRDSYQLHIHIENIELLNLLPNNIQMAVIYENNISTSICIIDKNVNYINSDFIIGPYGLNEFVITNSPNCRVRCYNGFTLQNAITQYAQYIDLDLMTGTITYIDPFNSDNVMYSISWSFINNEYVPFVYKYQTLQNNMDIASLKHNIIYKYTHISMNMATIIEMYDVKSDFILLPPGQYMTTSNNIHVPNLTVYLTQVINNSIYIYTVL